MNLNVSQHCFYGKMCSTFQINSKQIFEAYPVNEGAYVYYLSYCIILFFSLECKFLMVRYYCLYICLLP